MFVAILGFLGLLLHGVETGVRVMRTRRHPDRFAGWRLRLLSRGHSYSRSSVAAAFNTFRSDGKRDGTAS